MIEDKVTMRKRDFITSLILICTSIGILIGASRMPMKGNYGGVQNAWYVSPALLPLIIGIGLLILSCILLINSIVSKGAKGVIDDVVAFASKKNRHTASNSDSVENSAKLANQISQFRVSIVVLEFFILIFLLIPRVDFLISLIFFLLSVMGMFYLNQATLFRNVAKLLIAWTLILGSIAWSNLDVLLVQTFEFTLDIIVFVMTVSIYIVLRKEAIKDAEIKKKLRIVLLLSIAVPVIVTAVFRYALLVPLPVEGLFFDRICNSIYYALR